MNASFLPPFGRKPNSQFKTTFDWHACGMVTALCLGAQIDLFFGLVARKVVPRLRLPSYRGNIHRHLLTLANNMNDDQFILNLQAGHVAPEQFNHRAHLRAAFIFLKQTPFLEACIAMRDTLKNFAARIGKADLYHETITLSLMSLMAERMENCAHASFDEFIQAHPELCEQAPLSRYYSAATLASTQARKHFILPGRDPKQEGK